MVISWWLEPCTLRTPSYGSLYPRATWYIQPCTPIIANLECVYGQVWGHIFPQTAASLGQMFILWWLERCTICTTSYGSLCPRATWYIQLLYPYNCKSEARIWPSLEGLESPYSHKLFVVRVDAKFMIARTVYFCSTSHGALGPSVIR